MEEEGGRESELRLDPSHSQYFKKLTHVHNTSYCRLQANPCDVYHGHVRASVPAPLGYDSISPRDHIVSRMFPWIQSNNVHFHPGAIFSPAV